MIAIGAAGAVAGALVTQLVAGTGAPAPSSERDRIAALERKLEALERRPSLPVRAHASGAAAPIAASAAAGDPREAAEAAPPRTPPSDDRGASAIAALYGRLDERVEREPPDAAWRPAAALADTLRTAAPDVRLAGTRCGTTLCKVDVILASDDAQQLARQIEGKAPFAAGTLYRYDLEATPPRATLYVARPGYDLDPGDG